MSLSGLVSVFAHSEVLDGVLHAPGGPVAVAPGGQAPTLAALLHTRQREGHRPAVCAITATSREADVLARALRSLLPEDAEMYSFPAWETLPHERLSPSAKTIGHRIRTLRRVREWDAAQEPQPLVLIASVRAALQPMVAGLGDVAPIRLQRGSRDWPPTDLVARLVDFAYTRVDLVARRGEFAVRGGILDVFPPTADHPARLEFFGNEVEEMRTFQVADQRSLPDGDIAEVELVPCRELLLTPDVRQRARALAAEFPALAGLLERIAEGIPTEGMEALLPVLQPHFVSLAEALPKDVAVVVLEPERVVSRAEHLRETNREFLAAAWNAATVGVDAPIDLGQADFVTLDDLRRATLAEASRDWWTFTAFDPGAAALPADPDGLSGAGVRASGTVALPSFAGSATGAIDHLRGRLQDGWAVTLVAVGAGMVDRAAQVLGDADIPVRHVSALDGAPEPGIVTLTRGDLTHGFEVPALRWCVVTDGEFSGRGATYQMPVRNATARSRGRVDPLQLTPGEYVVHETHGIGRFAELVKREVATGARPKGPSRTAGIAGQPTAIREYVVLEYAPSKRGQPGDRLYVPMDQLDLLSRYVGGESPTLSKMGGSDWAQAKGRARKAVRDIAVELVKLYSARMSSRGHAFAVDTPWQRELEDAFPFVETPDQMQTIDEVKADMERPIPMDRLLAGDVGFGKTEVAVRAAFKAIQDGKQVAMLVPTTLLVRQHLDTFTARFAGFPVHVRPLSRFQTGSEARSTLAGLADGTVDCVIATHRLLAGGVQFKDLGLLIIDEEQRFGVEHKDALKKLRTNVDILAMSATPIPRTLEMAVTGIREMSTLATPPEDRHPILTYVGAYSEPQVTAAIRRELLREGQVFFVHNRVKSINRVAAQLSELVPEARIAVAHGQLPEHTLERIVVDFWERKFDILVSTTIIETGLDIQNANTIIIDRAEIYGLSQLHQLRGRVGRGRERAYAYFLYDPDTPLSETAYDRLSTIAANNELGGGMRIALKDLELRGAGNLLGAEQAGHIAGVGFDLYLRMIGEAVSAFRGDTAAPTAELRLELPIDAHIPDDYVASERLRLEAYQKLAAAAAPTAPDDQIDAVRDELVDRYGTPPDAVHRLLRTTELRRLAQQLGLREVVAAASQLRVVPTVLPDSRRVRLERLYPGSRLIAAQEVALIPLPSGGAAEPDTDLVTWASTLLRQVFAPDPAPPQAVADPAAPAALSGSGA